MAGPAPKHRKKIGWMAGDGDLFVGLINNSKKGEDIYFKSLTVTVPSGIPPNFGKLKGSRARLGIVSRRNGNLCTFKLLVQARLQT